VGPQVAPYGDNFPPVPVPTGSGSALSDAAPLAVGVTDPGVAGEASRADHVHEHGAQAGGALHADATPLAAGFMSAAQVLALQGATQPSDAAPQALGPPAAGASVEASRADHVHEHGSQAGGALHTAVTLLASGFMTPTQLQRLDAVRSLQVAIESNAGVATFYARARVLASGASFFCGLPMPPDFGTLVALKCWIIPQATEAARSFTLDTQWGPAGGPVAPNTDSENVVVDLTTATQVLLDFPNALTGVQAGDLVGLRLTNGNATNPYWVRVILDYLPA
jgi:hypothetical protein